MVAAAAHDDAGDPRVPYRSALTELQDAAAELRDVCAHLVDRMQRAIDHVDAGGRVSDIPDEISLRALRSELDGGMARLNSAKMVVRTHTVRLAVAEGTSPAEVARLYGLSRQYMTKLLRQAASADDASAPPG